MTYDVRQFRQSVWLLMLLGVAGFALAAQSLLYLLIGAGAVLANIMITRAGLFKPLPRPLANLVTLVALFYVGRQISGAVGTQVMVIGQFLLFLQLVKLWEQRGNRDWTQVLVLSFLLMVAACMNTASLWFCMILVVYLLVLLYCCLLFQLKTESEAAAQAAPVHVTPITDAALRQDQRHLSRSMRLLTLVVSSVGVVFAIAIFVAFPRWGAGMLGPRFTLDNPLSGFSDHVSFQSLAKITLNHERIAFVKVWHNGQLVQGSQSLLLRGFTFDEYSRRGDHSWGRTFDDTLPPHRLRAEQPDDIESRTTNAWEQEFILWPTNTTALFALPGVQRFTPREQLNVRYRESDGTLRTYNPPHDRIEYNVVSSNTFAPEHDWTGPQRTTVQRRFSKVFDFARKAEVSGTDSQGRSLADQRVAAPEGVSPLDRTIAANIENYLRTRFTYTLDLTDEQQVKDKDPLEQFLYNWKRGHCEYFAGAMTLMCQSLGMDARMVIGFKCGPDDYNDFTQSYAVYESDAHAWVEVKTTKGWEPFDPTSSRTDDQQKSGMLARLKQLREYMELKYANAVIAYDAQSRQNVMGLLEKHAGQSSALVLSVFEAIEDWMAQHSAGAIFGAFSALTMVVAASGARLIWDRRRLLNRAARIGLQSLPQDQQLKLARQLGFYDDMVQMLEDRRIVRQPQHTPLEFSRSLSFLPSGIYDTVLRLTRLFYQIRYGGAELTPPRRRRLQNVLSRLHHELDHSLPTSK